MAATRPHFDPVFMVPFSSSLCIGVYLGHLGRGPSHMGGRRIRPRQIVVSTVGDIPFRNGVATRPYEVLDSRDFLAVGV